MNLKLTDKIAVSGSRISKSAGPIAVLAALVSFSMPGAAQSLTSASDSTGVPSGGVVAFATSCPSGWSEYTRARGRTIVGAGYYSEYYRGNSYAATYSLGARGGAALYRMNTNELPRHRHTDIGRHLGDADGSPYGQGWSGSHYTGYAGNSSPFDNRQPWVALRYCIKQ